MGFFTRAAVEKMYDDYKEYKKDAYQEDKRGPLEGVSAYNVMGRDLQMGELDKKDSVLDESNIGLNQSVNEDRDAGMRNRLYG